MVEYEVLSASDETIRVCNLLCWDAEYNRLLVLKVKEMTAEGARMLINQKILVGTSNKEIIPEDISLKDKVMKT